MREGGGILDGQVLSFLRTPDLSPMETSIFGRHTACFERIIAFWKLGKRLCSKFKCCWRCRGIGPLFKLARLRCHGSHSAGRPSPALVVVLVLSVSCHKLFAYTRKWIGVGLTPETEPRKRTLLSLMDQKGVFLGLVDENVRGVQ